MASTEIDLQRLAALIAKKRNGRPYRTVAQEIGEVSSPTLSRIEKGRLPDLDTYIRICRWLNISPEDLQNEKTTKGKGEDLSNSEQVCAFLRADQNLPTDTAKALTKMIEIAYQDAISGNITEE